MVRLKVKAFGNALATVGHFNSNMVRLKVEFDPTTEIGSTLFQFQYGAIKRRVVY